MYLTLDVLILHIGLSVRNKMKFGKSNSDQSTGKSVSHVTQFLSCRAELRYSRDDPLLFREICSI